MCLTINNLTYFFMKRLVTCTILSLLFMGALPQKAKAARAAAGEIIYEWISDSTYRFFFKHYNRCGGPDADTIQKLCIYNSCKDTAYHMDMIKWAGLLPGGGTNPAITNICPQSKNTCDSPASSFIGFKETWFSAIVTLRGRCSLWKFSVSVSERAPSVNLQAVSGSNAMYLETTLNNLLFQGNSSPYMTIRPLAFTYVNRYITYNNGAIDPNRDSLVTEVIATLTRDTFCDAAVAPVAFTAAQPPLSIPANPFQTNNTLTVVPSTGQISFKATAAGINTMTTITKEYRNGILVGSVMRQVSLQMLTDVIDSPILTIDTPTLTGGYFADGHINLCAGQKLEFCWDVEGTDPSSIFAVSDNYRSVLPNATVTYTNRNTDSVRGCLSWQPDSATVGNFPLNITIKDSTCRPPGILLYYGHTVPIRVWGPALALKDTSVCQGQSVTLRAQNGGDYTWSVISGTAGNVSCYTCDTTIVQPTVTTKYRLVSAASAVCGNNTDTVTVSVWPTVKSNIKIMGSDTAITEGKTVYFNSLGVNCITPGYQWRINGVNIPGATSGSFATSSLKDKDTVTCVLDCGDTCATPPMAVSNMVVIHVTAVPPPPTTVKQPKGEIFNVFPNPNNGNFILKGNAEVGQIGLLMTNAMGQTVYTETWNNERATAIEQSIVTNNLPAGLYMLHINTPSGTATMKIIIRQ